MMNDSGSAMERSGYLNSPLDIQQLFQEAKHRWLRPIEVCEILRNYQQLRITAEAPTRPPAGSLYLFDRKALRFFRKDGHRWRKKKDGKTVREAHEKLKAGSVDVLHCYYAHGEDNENFQRRSYWMLEAPLDRIVLVHYRDVKQAYTGSISSFKNGDLGTKGGILVGNSFSFLPHDNPLAAVSDVQSAFQLSQMNVRWNRQTPPSVFDTENTVNYPVTSPFAQPAYASISRHYSSGQNKISGSLEGSRNRHVSYSNDSQAISSHVSADICFPYLVDAIVGDPLCGFKWPNGGEGDFIPNKIDVKLDSGTIVRDMTLGYELKSDVDTPVPKAFQEKSNNSNENQVPNFSDILVVSSTSQVVSRPCKEASDNNTLIALQKLDSFGRWMNNELGKDCDDSLMASDSGKYWNCLDNENDGVEVSSLSNHNHMHLDVDSFGPSLSQEQLFTICDFSPDWAYSGMDTKVLITGTFLVNSRRTSGIKWSCMFGEIEVSAERLTEHVLRCQAPSHAPGHVPFYITCSNRLACSEIREFHYREKSNKPLPAIDSIVEDAVYIQVRLAKILCSVKASKRPDCSGGECDKCQIKQVLFSLWSDRQGEWRKIEEVIASRGNCIADLVMQRLLEDKLYEWLIFKLHEGGIGVHVLDKLGQGVIHLAAALGYEWAMKPIIAAGISPNFRDARGRTALHWASYYGREETVIALVKLGAAAGAVDDPTSVFPGGLKAADLASNNGYKGIAGYLAEADLISHLSSMTINSHARTIGPTTTPAQNISDTPEQFIVSSVGVLEELSLRKSLDAVRKSAHAVASIHSMLRSLSLKQKQSVTNDISKAPRDLVLGSLQHVQKVKHFDDYLHVAAEKLQNKYRAWKKRQEFLKMRSRIVKIQAHYRGHQVRKQYKKVIWSVGIVEKAILRWRRKGSGLRGFKVGMGIESISPDKMDEYDFLRIGRAQKFAGIELALCRVKSMSRNPAARDQYMRLLSTFENFKIDNEEKGRAIANKNTKQ